jgi:hypothetical protein
MRFHLFLPTDVVQKLIKIAEREDRTARQQATKLLREAIEKESINTPRPYEESACAATAR